MGLTQKLGTIPLAILTDTSNNVGIGGSPSGSYKLEVTGTAKVSSTLLVSGAATLSSSLTATSTITSNNAIGVEKNGSGTFGGGGRFYLYNAATTDGMLMQLNASNNIDYWGVTSNTATASPVITFTRAGAATFSSSVTANNISTSYSGLASYNSFGNNIFIQPNGANNSFIADNIYYSSGFKLANAGAGAMVYFGASAAGSIDFRTAPTGSSGGTPTITTRMTILEGGNVGIGTTNPEAPLEIYRPTAGDAIILSAPLDTGNSNYLAWNHSKTRSLISARIGTKDDGNYGGNIVFENRTGLGTTTTERMRIKSNGDIKIQTGNLLGWSDYSAGSTGVGIVGSGENLLFYSSGSERMRITSGGKVMVNTTDTGVNALLYSSANQNEPYPIGSRAMTSSQGLVGFFDSANAVQGSISISGSTVSYNSFMGSHYSQFKNNDKPEVYKGTILEAIDELCEWEGEINDRLAKVKISDTIESKNVYGIFFGWDNTDEYNDMYVAALGASYIRVNSNSIVSMGDLLQSNGDGTAKVQSDDIMRSSTIAKVVSTQKIETYEDGSYLIAATLHCG